MKNKLHLALLVGVIGSLSLVTLIGFNGSDSDLLRANTMEDLSSENNDTDWSMFGGGTDNNLYAEGETVIGPENVGNLVEKWSTSMAGVPLKSMITDGDSVYGNTYDFFAPNDTVFRLDKEDGSIIWQTPLMALLQSTFPGEEFPVIHTQTAPAIIKDKLVVSTTGSSAAPPFGSGYVIVADKLTGQPQCGVQISEHPFEGVLGSPVVLEHEKAGKTTDIGIFGVSGYEEDVLPEEERNFSTIGKVTAVDLDTCEILWNSYMIDANPTTPEYDAQWILPNGKLQADVTSYAGATVWSSSMAYDPERETVTFTTGNAYSYDVMDPNISQPEDLDPEQLAINAFVTVDVNNGKKKAVTRVIPGDFWNTACNTPGGALANCDFDAGPDFDFGSGPNLLRDVENIYDFDIDEDGEIDETIDMYVAINKNGEVYRAESTTLELLENPEGEYGTKVGPSNLLSIAGTASDGQLIYAVNPNTYDAGENLDPISREWQLIGGPNNGETVYGGTVSAIDPVDGSIVWQNADDYNFEPFTAKVAALFGLDPFVVQALNDVLLLDYYGTSWYLGPPTVANGVVYVPVGAPSVFWTPSLPTTAFDSPLFDQLSNLVFGFIFASHNPFAQPATFLAFDAETGEQLWDYTSTGFSTPGAAIVDGVVYWGSLDAQTFGATLSAFELAQ